jgi:hypothetical protein
MTAGVACVLPRATLATSPAGRPLLVKVSEASRGACEQPAERSYARPSIVMVSGCAPTRW